MTKIKYNYQRFFQKPSSEISRVRGFFNNLPVEYSVRRQHLYPEQHRVPFSWVPFPMPRPRWRCRNCLYNPSVGDSHDLTFPVVLSSGEGGSHIVADELNQLAVINSLGNEYSRSAVSRWVRSDLLEPHGFDRSMRRTGQPLVAAVDIFQLLFLDII